MMDTGTKERASRRKSKLSIGYESGNQGFASNGVFQVDCSPMANYTTPNHVLQRPLGCLRAQSHTPLNRAQWELSHIDGGLMS